MAARTFGFVPEGVQGRRLPTKSFWRQNTSAINTAEPRNNARYGCLRIIPPSVTPSRAEPSMIEQELLGVEQCPGQVLGTELTLVGHQTRLCQLALQPRQLLVLRAEVVGQRRPLFGRPFRRLDVQRFRDRLRRSAQHQRPL